MDQLKKVAILLSTYNGEKFLNQQLNSIAEQTYKNITLIIRDDGSTDNTLKIIENFSDKIKIIQLDSNGENLGPAKSFMKLAKSCGDYDYYAFADQDDLWDKNKIFCAVNMLESEEDAPKLYFCRSRCINADGAHISDDAIIEQKYLTIESELTCGFCPGCAMVFNQALMNAVRNQEYHSLPMHDMVFIMTAFAIGEVFYDRNIYFSRRMHGGNVVGRQGKNVLQKLTQSYIRWTKSSKDNPIDIFTDDFLKNISNACKVKDKERKELKTLANYKHSFKNKMYILKCDKFKTKSKSAQRSFQIRLLLNLL